MAKRKRVNKNLIAGLTLGAMALSVAVVAVATMQLAVREPEALAERAREAEAGGALPRARDLYLQAFDVSKDVKYVIESARCAFSLGDFPRAFGMMALAHAQQPENADLMTFYLERLWDLSRYGVNMSREMSEYADKLLAVDPDRVIGLVSRAEARRAMIDRDAKNAQIAEEALARAVELAPQDARVAIVRARHALSKAVELERGRRGIGMPSREESELRSTAARILQDAMKTHKGDPDLAAEATRLLVDTGHLDIARAVVDEALAAHPDHPDLLEASGRTALQALVQSGSERLDPQRREELTKLAERDFSRARDLEPAIYDCYRGMAQLKLRNLDQGASSEEKLKQFNLALDMYRDGLDKTVGLQSVRKALGETQRAHMIFEAFQTAMALFDNVQSPEAKTIALDRAATFLKDAQTSFGHSELTPYMEGQLALARKDSHAALKAFLATEEKARENMVLRRIAAERLGVLYAGQREYGQALDYFSKAIQMYVDNGENAPLFLYIGKGEILNALERPQEALDLLASIERTFGQNADLQRVRAVALTKLDRAPEAIKELEAGPSRGDVDTKIELARLSAGQGNYQRAEELLREVLQERPESLSAIDLFARVMINSKQSEIGLAVLRELEGRVSSASTVHFIKMRQALLSSTDPEERDRNIFEQLKTIEDPWARHWDMYAFLVQKQKLDEALQHLDELAKIKPDYPGIIMERFKIALVQEKFDLAEQYAARLTELNADKTNGALIRGELEMARGRPAAALTEFRAALQQAPPSSELHQRIAQALLRHDPPRFEAALPSLMEAVESNPLNFEANKLLFATYEQLGRRDEGIPYLQAAARLRPDDPFIKERKDFLDEESNPKSGIARREKVRAEKPDDLANLIRLGELYGRVGETAKARDVFAAAVKLAPTESGVIAKAAEFYASIDDRAAGEKLLDDFIGQATEPRHRVLGQIMLARFSEKVGELAGAQEAYLKAIEVASQIGGKDQAMAEVEAHFQLIDFYARNRRYDPLIETARRALERLPEGEPELEARGRLRIIEALLIKQKFAEAQTELDDFTKRFPKDPRGLVAESQLLMSRRDLNGARERLSRALRDEPDHAWALFSRGNINLMLERYEEAQADLLRAKELQPKAFEFAHRLRLVDLYKVTDRYNLAEAELRDLVAENPTNLRLVLQLVSLLQEQGHNDRAQQVVTEYMARQPQDPWGSFQLANLLMEREEYSAAVRYFRQAVDLSEAKQPVFVADWLEALALSNRANEAITAFEKLPAEQVQPVIRAAVARAYILLPIPRPADARKQIEQALVDAAARRMQEVVFIAQRVFRLIPAENQDMLDKLVARTDVPEAALARLRIVRAQYLLETDKVAEASTAIEEVLGKLQPGTEEHMKATVVRARTHEKSGEMEKMVACYEGILKLDPFHAESLNNLAYTLADKFSRPKEALVYAERLYPLAGDSGDFLDTVGWVFFLNDRHADSETVLRQAVRAAPLRLSYRDHLAQVIARAGRTVEAREAYRQLMELARKRGDVEYQKIAERGLASVQ